MNEKPQLIDHYCERLAWGYGNEIGEPVNTITNIAFIIAAIVSIKLFYKKL